MKRFVGLAAWISVCSLLALNQAAAGVTAASSTPGYRAEAVDLKRDGTGGVTLALKLFLR